MLLFALIERTDEYQLVSFICRFKAIQCVVLGVLPALVVSIKHVACLDGELQDAWQDALACAHMPRFIVAEVRAEATEGVRGRRQAQC